FADLLDQIERDYADDFASGRIAESPAKLRRMILYFRAVLDGEGFPPARCNAPHLSTVGQVDGTLRPCYFLPVMARTGGDNTGLDERVPLQEAINVPEALALRRAYRNGARPECASCVCPLYKGPRALLRL
ncbi:MAG: hypothetical protein KC519_05830, partial [Anaerolineae bacterium]|nr:hypothetical protein [Anaerolineae bacterium]